MLSSIAFFRNSRGLELGAQTAMRKARISCCPVSFKFKRCFPDLSRNTFNFQQAEGFGHFDEGRAIAQCSGLALNDRQIMAPVIDDASWLAVGSIDDPLMCANDMAFGDNHQPFGVDAQAHRPVRKAGGHGITVAIEGDQAPSRDIAAQCTAGQWVGDTRFLSSTKPSNIVGRGIRADFSASQT